MSRNLVICCDGTNNKFGTENTNVVRLVQVLERDPARQRLYYDPGVGTLPEPGALSRLGKLVSEIKGLAFGAGLSRNVEEAYSFLMDVWQPGDRVFLFGFSRGAYTVRVLAGLLHSLGLLPRGGTNLVPYVMRLFRAVRKQKHGENGADASKYWKLCNQFRWTFARTMPGGDDERRFRVHFLGVWDTVSSVGWVWNPTTYPFTARNPGVDIVRHAVSVDERRWFFRQNLIQPAPKQDCQELWFPGVHCDVGGGYEEARGQLWRIPFEWILDEAAGVGLLVDARRRARIAPAPAPSVNFWNEQLNNSLTVKWWPAEFCPKLVWKRDRARRVPRIGLFGRRFIKDGDLLHRSTLLRIRAGNGYKPRNMSETFLSKVGALEDVPKALAYKKVAEEK